MIELDTRNAEETRDLGRRIGALLQPGEVVLLRGELGAGKTVLVQGIARGIGIDDPVTSPTFTLIHEYGSSDCPLIHVDLYRLEKPEDLESIGLEEMFDGLSVVVVEWSERMGRLTPAEYLLVQIRAEEGDRRRILLEARGGRYEHLIERLRLGPC